MQPLAAQTTSQDEAFGIRETKSDTNLRGLLQHTLSSLAMGWPLKAWGRRRSSRIVQSTDSGVEEEVAPFGWIAHAAEAAADSSAGDYGWFEFTEAAEAPTLSGGERNPNKVMIRGRRHKNTAELFHEETLMRLGLGSSPSLSHLNSSTTATAASSSAANGLHRAAAPSSTASGSSSAQQQQQQQQVQQVPPAPPAQMITSPAGVLHLRQSEPNFIVATRSFADLRLQEWGEWEDEDLQEDELEDGELQDSEDEG
eukprot:13114-Heterococcus_DN1.PRE.1